jgi:hypothetical protein
MGQFNVCGSSELSGGRVAGQEDTGYETLFKVSSQPPLKRCSHLRASADRRCGAWRPDQLRARATCGSGM